MMTPFFMFATGIENSVPTINGGRTRIDQYEKCGHYKYWKEDFALTKELGIIFLRYGPPIHRTWVAPGRYDWEFADITFREIMERVWFRLSTFAISACRTGWGISRTLSSHSSSRRMPRISRCGFPGCSSTR